MASSFAIGGSSVGIAVADADGFQDTAGAGQEMRVPMLLASVSDYNTLGTLLTRQVDVAYPPSGTAPVIDLGYGAGGGTLTLDSVSGSPFSAALTGLTRPSAFPDGKVRCEGTFLKLA